MRLWVENSLVPFFPISAHPKIDNNKAVNFSGLLSGLVLLNDNGIFTQELFPDFEKYYSHDFAIIFLINHNSLLRYDKKTERLTTKRFGDQIVEEPVIHGNTLFLIGHGDNETFIHVFDIDTLECLHTERFPFRVTHGFHGTFVPLIK